MHDSDYNYSFRAHNYAAYRVTLPVGAMPLGQRLKTAWKLVRGSATITVPNSVQLRDYLDGSANTPRSEMRRWREQFTRALPKREPLHSSELR